MTILQFWSKNIIFWIIASWTNENGPDLVHFEWSRQIFNGQRQLSEFWMN